MIPSTPLRGSKISLLVISILFNKWSTIYLARLNKFAFTSRYETNSSSTLFTHWYSYKSSLHILVDHRIKTIYRNAADLLPFARVMPCKRFSLESGYFSPCNLLSLRWTENGVFPWSSRSRVVGTLMAIWWRSLADYLALLQVQAITFIKGNAIFLGNPIYRRKQYWRPSIFTALMTMMAPSSKTSTILDIKLIPE